MVEPNLNPLEALVASANAEPAISAGLRCRVLGAAGRARLEKVASRRRRLAVAACLCGMLGGTFLIDQALMQLSRGVSAAPVAADAPAGGDEVAAAWGEDSRLLALSSHSEWSLVDATVLSRQYQLRQLLGMF